jgi:hypothetical protein
LRAELRLRAELLLCPQVLPQEVLPAPLLPPQVPSTLLLCSGLLRPGLRTELRLRWLVPKRHASETLFGLLDS